MCLATAEKCGIITSTVQVSHLVMPPSDLDDISHWLDYQSCIYIIIYSVHVIAIVISGKHPLP